MAGDTKRIHEGTRMLLFHFFIRNLLRTALNGRDFLSTSSCTGKERELTLYCEFLNYLVATYSFDSIITQADTNGMNFKQLAEQSAVSYEQASRTNALQYGPVYNECDLRRTFIEG